MTYLHTVFYKCFLERKAAPDQKGNRVLFPVRSYIRDGIYKFAIFPDTILRYITGNYGTFTHIMNIRSPFHNLQNRTRFRVFRCKYLKIIRILFRKNHEISLCIACAHTCSWKVYGSFTDQFPGIFRSCVGKVICIHSVSSCLCFIVIVPL